MSLSIQRTALIIIAIKFIIFMIIGGVTGIALMDTDDSDLQTFQEQTLERQLELSTGFSDGAVDISNQYNDPSVGDEKLAFEMGFSSVLMAGLIWIPSDWVGEPFLKDILNIINFFFAVLTALAMFEIIQMVRGKVT